MSGVLARAPVGRTDRNEYLKQYGLHNFENFLWKFNNSDPYKATGYDCLHFFDGGIWGRHIWPLIKGYIQRKGLASTFNANMAKFPRWRGLKHLSSPTTIDYSEEQTFLDILKCALPCIVQILPPNSCLVRVIRIMVEVRMLLGLEVTLVTRLALLRKFIAEYEKICKDVSETHGKSFDFLKQHFLLHAIGCFEGKGTSRNQNNRVGEGFQQEIAAQYEKTNGKDAEHQVSIMDENEETMALLDMKVNEWRKAQEEDDTDPILPSHTVTAHWKLGSADACMTSTRIESLNRTNSLYRDFNMRLREYLAEHYPNHPVPYEQDIQVRISTLPFSPSLSTLALLVEPCKVLYVDFKSQVDWNKGTDILRCNPIFHGRQRYDSIIYEAQGDDLAMGQLELVFRCHLSKKIQEQICRDGIALDSPRHRRPPPPCTLTATRALSYRLPPTPPPPRAGPASPAVAPMMVPALANRQCAKLSPSPSPRRRRIPVHDSLFLAYRGAASGFPAIVRCVSLRFVTQLRRRLDHIYAALESLATPPRLPQHPLSTWALSTSKSPFKSIDDGVAPTNLRHPCTATTSSPPPPVSIHVSGTAPSRPFPRLRGVSPAAIRQRALVDARGAATPPAHPHPRSYLPGAQYSPVVGKGYTWAAGRQRAGEGFVGGALAGLRGQGCPGARSRCRFPRADALLHASTGSGAVVECAARTRRPRRPPPSPSPRRGPASRAPARKGVVGRLRVLLRAAGEGRDADGREYAAAVRVLDASVGLASAGPSGLTSVAYVPRPATLPARCYAKHCVRGLVVDDADVPDLTLLGFLLLDFPCSFPRDARSARSIRRAPRPLSPPAPSGAHHTIDILRTACVPAQDLARVPVGHGPRTCAVCAGENEFEGGGGRQRRGACGRRSQRRWYAMGWISGGAWGGRGRRRMQASMERPYDCDTASLMPQPCRTPAACCFRGARLRIRPPTAKQGLPTHAHDLTIDYRPKARPKALLWYLIAPSTLSHPLPTPNRRRSYGRPAASGCARCWIREEEVPPPHDLRDSRADDTGMMTRSEERLIFDDGDMYMSSAALGASSSASHAPAPTFFFVPQRFKSDSTVSSGARNDEADTEDPVAPMTPLPNARFDFRGCPPPTSGKGASVFPDEDDFVDAAGDVQIEDD
ncbi:hypothetical protein DFH09DRAFT_1322569 [Mycena vulgaris]|nr:hypothetical protein DFH09DRAFT_1322569 [Mycena vulgaris]